MKMTKPKSFIATHYGSNFRKQSETIAETVFVNRQAADTALKVRGMHIAAEGTISRVSLCGGLELVVPLENTLTFGAELQNLMARYGVLAVRSMTISVAADPKDGEDKAGAEDRPECSYVDVVVGRPLVTAESRGLGIAAYVERAK
jgi:hypothetical protein